MTTTPRTGAPTSRTTRYSDLFDIDRFKETPCSIAGVGAIGRQLALQLTSMGAEYLTICDPDSVSHENLGPQGYAPIDLNLPKVQVLGGLLLEANPDLNLVAPDALFTEADIAPITFCCVDSMDARREIAEWAFADPSCDLFIEARMAAESLHIYTVDTTDSDAKAAWRHHWFPSQEASPLSCTSRATLYCASIAASLMLAQYTIWLRDQPTDFHSDFNIRGLELSITSPGETLAGPPLANPAQ